jgi:hypothetical protein
LDADDDPRAIDRARASSVAAAAMGTIATVVDEHVVECLGHVFRRSVIHVVAVLLAGEKRMDAVVKLVVPNGVQPIAAPFRRSDEANVVLIGFGDHVNEPTGSVAGVKGDSPIFVDHGFAAVPAKIGIVPTLPTAKRQTLRSLAVTRDGRAVKGLLAF